MEWKGVESVEEAEEAVDWIQGYVQAKARRAEKEARDAWQNRDHYKEIQERDRYMIGPPDANTWATLLQMEIARQFYMDLVPFVIMLFLGSTGMAIGIGSYLSTGKMTFSAVVSAIAVLHCVWGVGEALFKAYSRKKKLPPVESKEHNHG